ncbi:hypothetical protein H0H92_011399 [Tricholoma furcatifolium]|nr:hypothetical protein H0H92_011399 [Tricholoma furcatifolium]
MLLSDTADSDIQIKTMLVKFVLIPNKPHQACHTRLPPPIFNDILQQPWAHAVRDLTLVVSGIPALISADRDDDVHTYCPHSNNAIVLKDAAKLKRKLEAAEKAADIPRQRQERPQIPQTCSFGAGASGSEAQNPDAGFGNVGEELDGDEEQKLLVLSHISNPLLFISAVIIPYVEQIANLDQDCAAEEHRLSEAFLKQENSKRSIDICGKCNPFEVRLFGLGVEAVEVCEY